MTAPQLHSSHNIVERTIEQLIFASRWLLAPIYVGLVVGLLVLLVKFVQRSIDLVGSILMTSGHYRPVIS